MSEPAQADAQPTKELKYPPSFVCVICNDRLAGPPKLTPPVGPICERCARKMGS